MWGLAMSGRSKLAQASRDIAKLGGEHWVLEQVREGRTRTRIAKAIGISRSLFYSWVKSVDGLIDRMQEADKEGAEALFEKADEVLERLHERHEETGEVPTTQEVTLAKARADIALRRAAALDSRFSRRQDGATVNINLDSEYIRALSDMSRRAIAAESVEEAEYEVEED